MSANSLSWGRKGSSKGNKESTCNFHRGHSLNSGIHVSRVRWIVQDRDTRSDCAFLAVRT